MLSARALFQDTVHLLLLQGKIWGKPVLTQTCPGWNMGDSWDLKYSGLWTGLTCQVRSRLAQVRRADAELWRGPG